MQKTDKTNYIFVVKMILAIISGLGAVIFVAIEYYSTVVAVIITGALGWVWLTIQEMKIVLLQEINEKLENKHS